MTEKQIKLRPFADTDAESIFELANNKNIWINLRDGFPHPYSLADARKYIAYCLSLNPPTCFAIEYGGELAGSIGLFPQSDVYSKSAEIGYWIGEPFWNKGIASRAVDMIVEYGFLNLDIIRIHTGVFSYNIASQKVLEKCRFVKEAVFKNAIWKDGRICDEIRYARLK